MKYQIHSSNWKPLPDKSLYSTVTHLQIRFQRPRKAKQDDFLRTVSVFHNLEILELQNADLFSMDMYSMEEYPYRFRTVKTLFLTNCSAYDFFQGNVLGFFKPEEIYISDYRSNRVCPKVELRKSIISYFQNKVKVVIL